MVLIGGVRHAVRQPHSRVQQQRRQHAASVVRQESHRLQLEVL